MHIPLHALPLIYVSSGEDPGSNFRGGNFSNIWQSSLMRSTKTGELDSKKKGFFPILIIFQSFFVIFLWSHDLKQATSLSVWLGVRRIPRVKDPGNEESENYWHLNT